MKSVIFDLDGTLHALAIGGKSPDRTGQISVVHLEVS
jgi:hypothetical protein